MWGGRGKGRVLFVIFVMLLKYCESKVIVVMESEMGWIFFFSYFCICSWKRYEGKRR